MEEKEFRDLLSGYMDEISDPKNKDVHFFKWFLIYRNMIHIWNS